MMKNNHWGNRSDQSLRASSDSQYPPRTSSVSKDNEVPGNANTLCSAPIPASLPRSYQAARGFFDRLLSNTTNPSRESNETVSASGVTSHGNQPQSPPMSPLSTSSTSSNYTYEVDELNRATASEPSLQLSHSSSVYSDIRNSNPYYRHSFFLPPPQTDGEERDIEPGQILAANGKTSSRHSRHAGFSHSVGELPLSGSNKKSLSNDLKPIERRPALINTTIQSGQSLPKANPDGERFGVATKETLRRSATGTSVTSFTSEYSADQSEISQASSRSRVKSWAANLKKWSFGESRSKGKPAEVKTEENITTKKISWRRSTADLLSSYTGGDRKGENKDRLFSRKKRPTTVLVQEQSAQSSDIMTHSTSSDGIHQHSELSRAREQSTNQISRASKCSSPEDFSSKENVGLESAAHVYQPSKVYRSHLSSSSIAIDPHKYLENDIRRNYSKHDNNEDSKSTEDEDDTITLKTYKENLLRSKAYLDSMEKWENQQFSKQQRAEEIFESDFDSVFRMNLNTDGYGIFSRLLQRNTVLSFDKAQQSRENPGLDCFCIILSHLTPAQIIRLAQTSKRMHAATMSAIFEKILFKPGSSCISSAILSSNIALEPDIATCTTKIGSEDLQESNNVFSLVKEMRQLEGMLCDGKISEKMSRGQTNRAMQSTGSFVKSLVFDSNWRIPQKYWKVMTPALEKLLMNGKMEGIVTFVWNLEIPITSGLMTFLASQESLTTLSLNCFHPIDGNVNKTLPRPLNKFGGLVVLELRRLGFCGGLAWESDKQYIREVFGMIIRSPTLRILRLGTGDCSTAAPLSPKQTEEQSEEGKTTDNQQGVRAWVDLPVFDYDLFKDVYHTIKINRNAPAPDSRQNTSISPLKNAYINFTARKHMYGIKELSLDGFIIDQRLLNSEDFADGGLETLRLTRCYCIPSYNEVSYETHILLGQDLRKSIRKVTLDEGLLSSVGEHNAKKVMNELLYVSLPHNHLSEGDISRDNTIRRKKQHSRELCILSSSYRRSEPLIVSLNTAEVLKRSFVAQMKAFKGAEPTKDIYIENKVEVLALSPGWKFRQEELGWLIESTIGLGLKELAIDIADNSWDHFLEIVPNIRNLTALYLYTPHTHILQRGTSSDILNAVSMTIPLARRSRLTTIKATGKSLKASFGETSLKQIPDKAGPFVEESNNTPLSGYTSTGHRRRFPIDDASDILRSIVIKIYEETKQEDEKAKGKEVRRRRYDENQTVLVSRNRGHPKLAWISIGKALWQVVRLKSTLVSQNFHRLDISPEEKNMRREGITEVEFLSSQGQKYQTESSQRWGLKRCLNRDASNAGIKIFDLGKEPRVGGE